MKEELQLQEATLNEVASLCRMSIYTSTDLTVGPLSLTALLTVEQLERNPRTLWFGWQQETHITTFADCCCSRCQTVVFCTNSGFSRPSIGSFLWMGKENSCISYRTIWFCCQSFSDYMNQTPFGVVLFVHHMDLLLILYIFEILHCS